MFNITIGDKTKKFMKLLGIESFPFTEFEVKSKFRKKIKECHSDKTKGDDSLTRRVIEAYTHIKHLAIDNNETVDKGKAILKAEHENEDMFEFFDTCPRCKGSGEIEHYNESSFKDCDRCAVKQYHFRWFSYSVSIGTIKIACKACKGTGKFKQRNGKVVTCYKCKGKKTFTVICPKCRGQKIIIEKARIVKTKCSRCGGSGRIKLDLFNPVIPKGAVL